MDPLLNTGLSALMKVKKTQIEMMRDRGYNVNDELEILGYQPSQFEDHYNKIMATNKVASFQAALNKVYFSADGTPVYVYYPDMPTGKQITSAQIAPLINLLEPIITGTEKTYRVRHVIIIAGATIHSDARNNLAKLKDINIETFLYDQLYSNPTGFFMTPKHELLSPEEAKEYLKQKGFKPTDMPQLSFQDPIVRYYGAKPGRIFRITRTNLAYESIVGEHIVHKMVVAKLLVENKTSKAKK